MAPPELEAGGDSPDYSVEGDSSPDYSSLREAVDAPADSSPPPLVTPERSGARKKEAGPMLSGRVGGGGTGPGTVLKVLMKLKNIYSFAGGQDLS